MKRLICLVTLFCSTVTAETTLAIIQGKLTPISCDSSSLMATFILSVAGGVTPYFYQIDKEAPVESTETSFTFASIAEPGLHTFTVRDSSSQAQNITIVVGPSEFTEIEALLTLPCSNDNNGSFELFIEGGMPPVIATLTKPNGTTEEQIRTVLPFTFNFDELRAGDYSVLLTSGPVNPNVIAEFIENKYCCPATVIAFTLPNPDPLRISTPIDTTPETAGQSNGTITVQTTGGIEVRYSNDNGQTFQESNVFTGLTAETYTVVARSGIAPAFCFSDPQTAVVELVP